MKYCDVCCNLMNSENIILSESRGRRGHIQHVYVIENASSPQSFSFKWQTKL